MAILYQTELVCDGCGTQEFDLGAQPTSKIDMREAYATDGWTQSRTRDFCPKCSEQRVQEGRA